MIFVVVKTPKGPRTAMQLNDGVVWYDQLALGIGKPIGISLGMQVQWLRLTGTGKVVLNVQLARGAFKEVKTIKYIL